jgi:hypothetical protein
MTVRNRQEQDQVLGVNNQAGPDDIPVGSVASCPSACLNLDHDPMTVVEWVYFIRHFWTPVATEKHGTPDTVGCSLTGFHSKPELAQASGDLLENPVTVQSRLAFNGGDALLGRPDVRDERLDPFRRPRIPREVVPRRI